MHARLNIVKSFPSCKPHLVSVCEFVAVTIDRHDDKLRLCTPAIDLTADSGQPCFGIID
jgi:hypothetical protein